MFGKKKSAGSIEHRLEWEAIRRDGMVDYVITRGVLISGAGAILTFLIFDVWIEHKPMGLLGLFITRHALEWLFGGFVTGYFEWESNEKRYHRETTEWYSGMSSSFESVSTESQRGIMNGNI